MKADELIERAKRDNTDEEWFKLKEDMRVFLNGDNPVEEKRRLGPLGWYEMVCNICADILRDD